MRLGYMDEDYAVAGALLTCEYCGCEYREADGCCTPFSRFRDLSVALARCSRANVVALSQAGVLDSLGFRMLHAHGCGAEAGAAYLVERLRELFEDAKLSD